MVKRPLIKKKPNNHGIRITGVAAGAAILGAAATALLTPKSGKETRQEIAKSGKRAADKVGKTVGGVEKKFAARVASQSKQSKETNAQASGTVPARKPRTSDTSGTKAKKTAVITAKARPTRLATPAKKPAK